MKKHISIKVLALVLSIMMVIQGMSMLAFAGDSDFSLTIASTKTSALAPGVQEQEIVAYDANGDRIVYYAVSADIASNPDVQVKANYKDNDNTGVWGKATVIEQANAATEKRGYNVVATTNAAYYNVTTGQPTGGFVMEGVNINGDSMGNSYPFFAIMKDGTAMIGQKGTFSQYSSNIQEAVGGWTMLVWDGKVVATNNTNKYPRSTVGVKENGDVVLMVCDGNQKPYSAGLTYVEQAQVMLQLGCVAAVELDGGGSATYAAKFEGTDELVLRNNPCDGTIRSLSNSLMVISTAVADGTFDHANLSTEYPFYAPNSDVTIDVFGADRGGYPAEVPENVTWALSDDSFGTVADGVFHSNGKLGTVTVNMLLDGAVVGSVDVTLVHPTEIAFQAEDKMIPYGRPSDMTVDALYNGADMYADASAYDFTCSAGSMNGFVYTAPEEGPTTATVKVQYKYDATVAPDTMNIEFGRGSDILFDFEDGIDNWGTYFDLKDAAEKGEYTNGYTISYESDGSTASNLVENGIHEDVFLATKENGKVYRGDYSLGYTLDYRYSQSHANWQYAYLYYWGKPIVLKDVDQGIAGTRLGMWMYIPEEAVGSCARFAYTYKQADGTLNTAYLYLTYQYVEKGFSKLTSDKIPEAGWAYVYVDMKQISDTYVSTSYFQTEDGVNTRPAGANTNYAPAFIQFIVSSSATGAEKCTFYIDDITLDYSDAVDDRDMPIISNPLILEDQDSYPIDGRTLNYNTITVTADAAEDTSRGSNYTGLNEATAQVYVDGHKVATKFAAGKISATGVVLPNGTHDITFEIADKQGNYTKLTKQIVIDAATEQPAVTLNGAAAALNASGLIYTGGQYNITLDTDKVEGIDSVNFKLWLNSASEWALDHMTVFGGFEVEYTLDENACTAEITVTRVDSDATGEATLLTIPVYAWSWNEELGLHDASTQWNSKGCAPQIAVSYKVKYGNVEYTDEYAVKDSNYVAGFSNKRVDAMTELNSSIANLKKTIGVWHYHTEVALADVDATCTTGGFYGRTECSVCKSIIDWGTTVAATGHKYVETNGVYKCDCGELCNGVIDGVTYIDGIKMTNGWYKDLYYFVDGVKVTGAYVIDKVVHVFDDNGVYQPDEMFSGWIDTVDGKMYFLSNTDYVDGYAMTSSVPRYFDKNGIARDGEYVVGGETCLFEDGAYVSCSTADVLIAGWAGYDCHFILYKDGRFIFSGEGDMFYHQSNSTIPWGSFKREIKSIFVGKDITNIARFAFAHCYYVTDLVFEEGSKLETISYSSFHYLNKLKEIVLPDTVETLEWRAFGYCTSLKKIYIPDRVVSINKNAFEKHNAELVLQVAKGTYGEEYANEYGFKTELRDKVSFVYSSGDCGNGLTYVLYDSGILYIDGNGTMSDFHYNKNDVNAAPWSAYRSLITKVVVGEGVEYIGKYAFYQCTALEAVEFAANAKLTAIGEGAFGYTSALKNVTLPASLTTINKNGFYFSGLETITVAEGSKLETIGDTAFRNCTALTSVYLPDDVKAIGYQIFRLCGDKLVVSVAQYTYAYRYAMSNGYTMDVRENEPEVKYSGTCGEGLTWAIYTDDVLYINGNGVMPDYHYNKKNENAAPWSAYRSEIKKAVIGAGVEYIGKYAFYQCTALEAVEFAADAKLTTIGEGAFGYTSALKSVTLPASLVTLSKNAFYFSALETVAVAEGSKLETIGDTAFRNCTALTSVYLPDDVKAIGYQIFRLCGDQVVVSVAEYTYAYRYAINNGYAMDVRENEPEVKYSGTCGEGLTWAIYTDDVLYINGNGVMPDYHYNKKNENAAPWSAYRSEIKKAVIGAGVEYIGTYAFYQCTALEAVEFAADAKLTTIGEGAFGYTSALKSVTLPASLKTIAKCGFYFSGLETVAFAEGSKLETIGDTAFRNCTALTSVYIPDSVKSIGYQIFRLCGDQVVVSVAEGSYAYDYANNNGYACEVR